MKKTKYDLKVAHKIRHNLSQIWLSGVDLTFWKKNLTDKTGRGGTKFSWGAKNQNNLSDSSDSLDSSDRPDMSDSSDRPDKPDRSDNLVQTGQIVQIVQIGPTGQIV